MVLENPTSKLTWKHAAHVFLKDVSDHDGR